jgi:hypothetical protein
MTALKNGRWDRTSALGMSGSSRNSLTTFSREVGCCSNAYIVQVMASAVVSRPVSHEPHRPHYSAEHIQDPLSALTGDDEHGAAIGQLIQGHWFGRVHQRAYEQGPPFVHGFLSDLFISELLDSLLHERPADGSDRLDVVANRPPFGRERLRQLPKGVGEPSTDALEGVVEWLRNHGEEPVRVDLAGVSAVAVHVLVYGGTWCTHVQRDFAKYREGKFRRQGPEVQHLVLSSGLVECGEHPL